MRHMVQLLKVSVGVSCRCHAVMHSSARSPCEAGMHVAGFPEVVVKVVSVGTRGRMGSLSIGADACVDHIYVTCSISSTFTPSIFPLPIPVGLARDARTVNYSGCKER